MYTAVSIPKEQVKDGEVFHLLSQKAVDIVRQKVGGEKVRMFRTVCCFHCDVDMGFSSPWTAVGSAHFLRTKNCAWGTD